MAVVPSAAQARGIVGAAVAAGALSLVGVLVTHDGAHASPAQSAAARYAVFQRAAKQADAVPVGLAGQDGSGQTRAPVDGLRPAGERGRQRRRRGGDDDLRT